MIALSNHAMWALFGGVVLGMLILDLGIFHRKSHVVKIREALVWTGAWLALAMAFMVFVNSWHGTKAAMEFATAYIVELSLSVDNLFVFLLIFTHFKVPSECRHKTLFWGILGAVVMRALFIGAGVALIHKFHFVMYIFGAVLVWSGVKIGLKKEEDEVDFEKSFVIKLARRFIPVSNRFEGDKFFVSQDGKTHATLLFIILLVVEASDVMFAVDSVPAVIAISKDPFIIYTSNVFAILGLRSLFFALAGLLDLFHYLNYGLCVILIFVGLKMLSSGFYEVPTLASLAVIVGVIAISVAASLLRPHAKPKKIA